MKIFSKNKKAFHDYNIVETIEAGLVLTGSEVKSIRASNIQLLGSYVILKDNHLTLTGCHISKPSNIGKTSFDEVRDRTLLVSKKQKNYLFSKVQEKTFSLVILEVYQPDNSKNIKAKLALVKGKKDYDKRKDLKEKQLDRDAKRDMKNH